MSMFKSQVKFVGKHAVILQKYCKDKGSDQDISFVVSNNEGENKSIYLFSRRIDLYMVAAMLGIICKKSVEIDEDKSITTSASIFADVFTGCRSDLERIYHHMVLSGDLTKSADARIKEAFSIMPDEKCNEEQHKFENYVRGGLEIFDDIFKNCKTYEDVCNAIYNLKEKLDNPE